MKRKVLISVLVSLMLAVFASGAGAVSAIPFDCQNPVSLDGVIVCYLGNVDNGDGTTTWTYAITPDPDSDYVAESLSHLVFEVCPADDEDGLAVVSPLTGDTYWTIASYGTVSGRVVPYLVNLGKDGSIPGITENLIKFTPAQTDVYTKLSGSDVDIFQYTQYTQANQGTALVEVAVKSGFGGVTGMIEGPVCGGTTAVNLVEFNASAGLFARLLAFFGVR